MKKTFHLDLDHTGVRLRHGSGADAPILGEVSLDDPHFDTRLEDLRRDAQALTDDPLTTKITIPQSEILFTSIDVPEDVTDNAARRKLIDAEMDGQTPYALDDLVIDWTEKKKGEIAVAAVARETLDQAEDFAVAHGFNPQGFTAEPRKGLFRKRPDFGKTAFATDGSMADLSRHEPEVTRIADVLDAAPADEPAPIAEDQPAPAVEEKIEPPEAKPEKAAPSPDQVPDVATAEAQKKEHAPEAAPNTPEPKVEDKTTAETAKPDPSPAERAAKAKGAVSGEQVSFATRRSGTSDTKGAAAASTSLGSIASRISSLPDGGAGPRPGERKTVPAMKVTNGGGAARKPQPAGRKAPTPTVRKVAPPAPGMTPKPANTPRPANALQPGIATDATPRTEAEQMTVFGARRDVQRGRGLAFLPVLVGLLVAFAIAVGIWAALFLLSPVEDALRDNPGDAGTAALIPQPGAVDGDATSNEGVVTPDLTPPPEDDVALLEPVEIPEPAVDEPSIVPSEAADALPAPAPDDPLQRPQNAGDEGRYAATGVEITPPDISGAPATDRLEELRAPQSDAALRAQDSVASLAPLADGPTAPRSLLPPPLPGQRFELDENGRVVATAEGALSPAGVRVTAGAPARRPPPAPERPEAPVSEENLVIPVNQGPSPGRPEPRPSTTEATASDAQEDAAAETPNSVATPDLVTRIAALSPRPRPAGLAPQASAPEIAQSASLFNGPTPRARPASLNVAEANAAPDADAVAARSGAAAASAAASALGALVPNVAAAVPVATSPYAVARSVVPETRPRNFQRTVARATQQQQQRRQQTQAQPVRVASASAIARPSGPTRGSVAQRATIANAINLGKVNLMGVYGTSSNRRALIRLPSGKFQKVKVGDRVDGGRVRAIAADALSYVKGGRQIVLRMPRG